MKYKEILKPQQGLPMPVHLKSRTFFVLLHVLAACHLKTHISSPLAPTKAGGKSAASEEIDVISGEQPPRFAAVYLNTDDSESKGQAEFSGQSSLFLLGKSVRPPETEDENFVDDRSESILI